MQVAGKITEREMASREIHMGRPSSPFPRVFTCLDENSGKSSSCNLDFGDLKKSPPPRLRLFGSSSWQATIVAEVAIMANTIAQPFSHDNGSSVLSTADMMGLSVPKKRRPKK